MYSVGIHATVQTIVSLFYRLGLWHHGKATLRQTRIKIFYCIYNLLFTISLIAGAITADDQDESIFLVELSIAAGVVSMKLWFLVWKKETISELLNRIGVYTISDREDSVRVDNTLKKFARFLFVLFLFISFAGISATVIVPFFGSERKLFVSIAFPLDWRNNEISFWIVNVFIVTEVCLWITVVGFSAIIWYLLLTCTLRYEILGNEIRNMGTPRSTVEATEKEVKITNVEKQRPFLRDLITAIDSHQHLRKLIKELELFVSKIFFVQIVTSAACICGSTYCLGFTIGDSFFEQIIHVVTLLYNTSDIFMISYLGHEIMHSSDRLSYCLFESNWVDQPRSTQKCILIFGELLQKPHQLIIVIYPLTLNTFTRIINSAYSMFNILKNLKYSDK